MHRIAGPYFVLKNELTQGRQKVMGSGWSGFLFFKERTGPGLEGVKADSWNECKVPKGEGRSERDCAAVKVRRRRRRRRQRGRGQGVNKSPRQFLSSRVL
jgi:hypothetical protein